MMKDANGKPLGSWPCQKPPWGQLIAVNANTGDIAWQVRLGITEGLPEDKQLTGSSSSAGPIATAGGLVFIGVDHRRALPRLRFENRQAALGRQARQKRERQSHDL